ncbi:MAG TPA: hypothetical protein VMG10_14630 [Gemmataceae bacterium]|nr:hypothetical protein [Gemmataceae bacterium]
MLLFRVVAELYRSTVTVSSLAGLTKPATAAVSAMELTTVALAGCWLVLIWGVVGLSVAWGREQKSAEGSEKGRKKDGKEQSTRHTGTRTVAETPQTRDYLVITEAFVEIGFQKKQGIPHTLYALDCQHLPSVWKDVDGRQGTSNDANNTRPEHRSGDTRKPIQPEPGPFRTPTDPQHI